MELILTTNEELSKVVNEAVNKAIGIVLNNQKEPKEYLDKWMNATELIEYIPDHPAIATIYGWVSSRQIPYHKNVGGKKLRFLKSEIDLWLSSGKRKSESELQTEASNRQSGKKGVRRYE